MAALAPPSSGARRHGRAEARAEPRWEPDRHERGARRRLARRWALILLDAGTRGFGRASPCEPRSRSVSQLSRCARDTAQAFSLVEHDLVADADVACAFRN